MPNKSVPLVPTPTSSHSTRRAHDGTPVSCCDVPDMPTEPSDTSKVGANVAGACEIARKAGPGAVVVTILPDRGDRYFKPMKWEKQYVW